jgi:hypothetical protein
MRRRAILARILLYSIQARKTLPITLSRKDHYVAVKALGGEFCDFLVDTGTMAEKFPAKVSDIHALEAAQCQMLVQMQLQQLISEETVISMELNRVILRDPRRFLEAMLVLS